MPDVAGLLLLSTAPHPDVFESTFAEAALGTPFWVAMHAALLLSAFFSLVGVCGLYALHGARLGRLGAVGIALAVTGLVVAACALYFEAFLLPVVARHDPALFAWDGPIIASWGFRLSALAGLWLVGMGLLGFALSSSGVVPRGGPDARRLRGRIRLLEGPFVPVLGPLSTLAFAVGHVWVGTALWTGAAASEVLVATGARTAGRRVVDPGPAAVASPAGPAGGAIRSAVTRRPVVAFLVLMFVITGAIEILPAPEMVHGSLENIVGRQCRRSS